MIGPTKKRTGTHDGRETIRIYSVGDTVK
jgi:hypothetical protein